MNILTTELFKSAQITENKNEHVLILLDVIIYIWSTQVQGLFTWRQ
jgi:hypothetical protein